MNTHHLIDSAVFDISYGHQEIAFEQQSDLDHFIKNDLMIVIDEVFNETETTGVVYRIPNLELDLGSIAYDEYHNEMPKRLRDRLISALGEIYHKQQTGQVYTNIVFDRTGAEEEQLFYFLRNGYLPWYSRLSSANEIELLLNRVIAASPGRFKSFLCNYQDKETVIKRLVTQFSCNVVNEVFSVLSSCHSSLVQPYMADLKNLIQRSDLPLNSYEIGSDAFIAMVWQYLITASVENTSTKFNFEHVFEQALKHILVNRLQIGIMGLAGRLTRLTLAPPRLSHLDAIIKNLLKDISINTSTHINEHALSDPVQVSANIEQGEAGHHTDIGKLYSLLVYALITGDYAGIKPYWSVLYHDHTQILEKALHLYGQQTTVRNQISLGFSEDMLHDILVLLVPLDHDFVQTIIDHAVIFRPDTRDSTSDLNKHRVKLWEYSLAYLLVEHDNRFTQKSYLNSLIGQMTSGRKQDQSALLFHMTENIAGLARSNELARDVILSLNELAHDLDTSIEQQDNRLVEQQTSYAEYERLKTTLTVSRYDNKDCESLLFEDIEKLRQHTPWLLMRLFREQQSDAYSWKPAINNLSVPLLRKLTYALLSVTSRVDVTQQSEFVSAIQNNAERSKNQKLFFTYIIECLLNGEWIDFDAAGTANQLLDLEKSDTNQCDIAPIEIMHDWAVHSDRPEIEQIEIEHAITLITDVLDGDYNLTAHSQTELIRSFQCLLVHQPQMLRKFILSGMNDMHFINRLAELLPDSLHIRLLKTLGMINYSPMLQCAELLNVACYVQEAGIQTNKLTQLKWQFIYTYVNKTGLLFNEQYFAKDYVVTLMMHTKLTDAHMFRSVLSQQLMRNSFPATREITQRLIKSLSYTEGVIPTPVPFDNDEAIDSDQKQYNDQAEVENIYIENAGIVISAPYLPRLFDMLGLTEKSAFKNQDAAECGVHMLQFLINEQVSSPEHQLVLNKLLCGINLGQPIRRTIMLGKDDKDKLESLLLGMIQHWKALGNTTLSGLRESFLQRNGRLQLKDDVWHLSVEAKSFDMLLDQIPWSYNTIKLPWMERVIYVEWR